MFDRDGGGIEYTEFQFAFFNRQMLAKEGDAGRSQELTPAGEIFENIKIETKSI